MKPTVIGGPVFVSGRVVFDGENVNHGRLIYLKLDEGEIIALNLASIKKVAEIPPELSGCELTVMGTYSEDIPDGRGGKADLIKLVKSSAIKVKSVEYI